jgi:REP element-mobilizing transposase RayT
MRSQLEARAALCQRIEDPDERRRQAYLDARWAFGQWDRALSHTTSSPKWLQNPHIAELVMEALHYRDNKVWDLLAFCIMPDHVHAVVKPLTRRDGVPEPLSAVMQSLKRYTARKANQVLHRRGTFWQDETYDHVVRDEAELARIIQYVLSNPVKAGLVSTWQAWPWTYVHPAYCPT